MWSGLTILFLPRSGKKQYEDTTTPPVSLRVCCWFQVLGDYPWHGQVLLNLSARPVGL